jgi:hypothetical protein
LLALQIIQNHSRSEKHMPSLPFSAAQLLILSLIVVRRPIRDMPAEFRLVLNVARELDFSGEDMGAFCALIDRVAVLRSPFFQSCAKAYWTL